MTSGSVRYCLRRIRQATPRCGSVVVVGIDGPAGSGKTTLAAALASATDAPVLRMDDLYEGWQGLAKAAPSLALDVLEPLAQGCAGSYRRYDWARGEWAERHEVPLTGLLIVDGVASTVPPAAGYVAVRVWVEAPPAVRLERGLARDGERYREQWVSWAAKESQLFGCHRSRAYADVRVDTSGDVPARQPGQPGTSQPSTR